MHRVITLDILLVLLQCLPVLQGTLQVMVVLEICGQLKLCSCLNVAWIDFSPIQSAVVLHLHFLSSLLPVSLILLIILSPPLSIPCRQYSDFIELPHTITKVVSLGDLLAYKAIEVSEMSLQRGVAHFL